MARFIVRVFALALIVGSTGCAEFSSGLSRLDPNLPGGIADLNKTVVYRDTWGVPHIYAPTEEGGFYAMGWAQAEDRPQELLKNIMRAIGESAKFD
jgi:acyl-homoserine lactone acylase PvdQ